MMRYTLLATAVLVLISISLCAALPADTLAAKGSLIIYFQPAASAVPPDAIVSDGSVYSSDKGFGWDQDMTQHSRDRSGKSHGIALLDRAIHTASFTIALPDGDYIFDVTSFDTDYPGVLAPVSDGRPVLPPKRYLAGESVSMALPVKSSGGKAVISFMGGTNGLPNSIISSLKITPASADAERWKSASDGVNAYQTQQMEIETIREMTRYHQREAYVPVILSKSAAPRQTVDLSGRWLFMPSQDIKDADAGGLSVDDWRWHVLRVPQFWNPIEWWIYNTGSGTSHNYLRKEIQRCENFTFDYRTTKSGWYRQWIDVPKSLQGKRFILKFDAVASVCEVYWNGKRIGSHVGMFGPFECEATPFVRYNQPNLLAVYVSSGKADKVGTGNTRAVAVTVNITQEMLNSLHHGWYKSGMAGIWQPVRLEITGRSRINNVFFKPWTTGAEIDTEVSRAEPGELKIRHTVVDAASGKVLYRDGPKEGKRVPGNSGPLPHRFRVTSVVAGVKPKLWSPEHPHLYKLKTQLMSGDRVLDEITTTVGFKTFEAKGSKLYLNGKPYFIRGADTPPHGLAPNDKKLADKFMKLMHDGNTMTTRFHVAPPSQLWLDACDKYGVGASVGESWPWVLMGDTPIPDRGLLAVWKQDFLEMVRANRNHPSLFMWTISNESYFEGRHDPNKSRKEEKYRIFSDLIKSVRSIDPQHLAVFHSGYVRPSEEDAFIKANAIDDGDIDDRHAYFGWYSKSPLQLDVFKDVEGSQKNRTRPLISQEASTGYPDNDTGHPTMSYIKNHIVPQAWVGDYALYNARPEMFLDTQAQISKDYVEKIRRDRINIAGWMLFANCCWFKDVYDPDTITPYPVYLAVKDASQPVLVSLMTPKRHFEAGQKFTSDICIVNDDPDHPVLKNAVLAWRIYGKSDDPGTSGIVQLPDCPYDARLTILVSFTIPADLPDDRSDMILEMSVIAGGEQVSQNNYPLICARKEWFTGKDDRQIVVLENDNKISTYLSNLGFTCKAIPYIDWISADVKTPVIVSPGSAAGSAEAVMKFAERGGRVLLFEPEAAVVSECCGDKCESVQVSGDFVDLLASELLSGMNPMDMHWWNPEDGDVVKVCRISYHVPTSKGVTMLARHIQPHGYIKKKDQIDSLTSYPLFAVNRGSGRIVISSLMLADDPVAKRFTRNLVEYTFR